MAIIAIMNEKGGVGKTTTATNVAFELAKKGLTLLIDADPQANSSILFGVENPKTTIRDAYLGNPFETVKVRKQLDLLPSSEDLIGIDITIMDKISREFLLKKSLKNHISNYDYIIIDCPPSINICTYNCLAFATHIIIPIETAKFSLKGVGAMIKFCAKVKIIPMKI